MRLLAILTSLFSPPSASPQSLSRGSTPQRYSSEAKSDHGSESDVRKVVRRTQES